jgi:Protein of unknown function (DUF1761)
MAAILKFLVGRCRERRAGFYPEMSTPHPWEEPTVSDLNLAAVAVAAVASFVASAVWYMIFGNAMARLQKKWRGAEPPAGPEPLKLLGFFATQLLLAVAVGYLFERAGVDDWPGAIGLGLVLWLGFCASQQVSSTLGEQVPVKLAAIHAGDWLMHLLIISTIIGLWR